MKTDSKNSSAAAAANEKMIANPIQEKIFLNGFCYQNRKEKKWGSCALVTTAHPLSTNH